MTDRRVFVILVALAACGPTATIEGRGAESADAGPRGAVRSDASTWPPAVYADAAPPRTCNKMDILFIIDDSGSMRQEQDNLAMNFPGFVAVLDQFVTASGELIDYQVAVTSTGVSKRWTEEILPGFPYPSAQSGHSGEMLRRCNMTRPWMSRSDANVADTFSCAAKIGVNGPANEMPLEAMRMAFDERIADGKNAGFLRQDALLAVVILTDEDDCSYATDNFALPALEPMCTKPSPVPPYAQFLDSVTGGPGRWAVAVIAGTGPGSCSSAFGDADEATRLIEFARLAGPNGIVSSICEGDLTVGLKQALETFGEACNTFPPIE
jgi:hypothetical protein